MNDKVAILILDFLKPEESKLCLESIDKNCLFNKKVIYLNNGGGFENQEYAVNYYKNGLIDNFIFNKINNGLGYGTEDLFRFCDTKYAIYLQNDQIVNYIITQEYIDTWVEFLETHKDTVGSISLAGFPCGQGVYSERAHLINVDFYNSIPKTHGGCGPFNHLKYNEQCCQEFFKEKNLQVIPTATPLIQDNGVWTIRELPCGGIVKTKTDTKETYWIKNPKEKYVFPEMGDSDWDDAINDNWEPGRIPNSMKHLSFKCWN